VRWAVRRHEALPAKGGKARGYYRVQAQLSKEIALDTLKIARQICQKSEAREFTNVVSVADAVGSPNFQERTRQTAFKNP
jgi:hypothetical protein